jgi:hypothetical protein
MEPAAGRDTGLLTSFVLGIGDIPVPGLHLLAWSRDQALRGANRSHRANAPIVRDAAITGFGHTGNRRRTSIGVIGGLWAGPRVARRSENGDVVLRPSMVARSRDRLL